MVVVCAASGCVVQNFLGQGGELGSGSEGGWRREESFSGKALLRFLEPREVTWCVWCLASGSDLVWQGTVSEVGARRLLNGGLVSGIRSEALVVRDGFMVALALALPADGRKMTFCCAPVVRLVGGTMYVG